MAPIAVDEAVSAVSAAVADPIAALKAVNGNKKESKQTTDGLDSDPLKRTYRSTRNEAIHLAQSYPDFKGDKEAERQHVKEHLAGAFQFWGKRGFGEGVAGHITYRDPILPHCYWMNPFAVHFSNVTVDNLVLVGPDGYITEHGAQLPINTAGYHIHSAIHKARPEIKAAAHCHSLHGKAWSVFGRKVDILTQDSCLLYDNQAVYANFGGVVLADEEGSNIAKALGPKFRTCILQNHGLLTVGDTVDEAVYLFSMLENQCKAQLLVEAASANPLCKKVTISDEDAAFTAATLRSPENVYVNFQTEYELLVRQEGHFFLGKK